MKTKEHIKHARTSRERAVGIFFQLEPHQTKFWMIAENGDKFVVYKLDTGWIIETANGEITK